MKPPYVSLGYPDFRQCHGLPERALDTLSSVPEICEPGLPGTSSDFQAVPQSPPMFRNGVLNVGSHVPGHVAPQFEPNGNFDRSFGQWGAAADVSYVMHPRDAYLMNGGATRHLAISANDSSHYQRSGVKEVSSEGFANRETAPVGKSEKHVLAEQRRRAKISCAMGRLRGLVSVGQKVRGVGGQGWQGRVFIYGWEWLGRGRTPVFGLASEGRVHTSTKSLSVTVPPNSEIGGSHIWIRFSGSM